MLATFNCYQLKVYYTGIICLPWQSDAVLLEDLKFEDVPVNASKKKSSSVKEQCPPDRCVMKRANKRTWWVQCAQCTQWYHIKCAKLTKQEAQDNEFTCEDCI